MAKKNGQESGKSNKVGKNNPPVEYQFSSTNQPKNRGRKPSILKKFIEDNGISSTDLSSMIKYVLPLTEEEVEAIKYDQSKPIVMRLFVGAILSDIEKSGLDNIMKLFDRAFGSPKQEIEHSTDPERPVMVSLGDILADSSKPKQ